MCLARILLCLPCLALVLPTFAQEAGWPVATRADTLRGTLRPARTAYDVTHYALDVELLPETKSIAGAVDIAYRGVHASDTIQVDLDPRLNISEIEQGTVGLGFRREAGAVFVGLARPTAPGQLDSLRVAYAGTPREAVNAPWDGGISWSADTLGRPWLGVSCEGLGASVWWPNKDHLSDEPDSVSIAVTVPGKLDVVANGQARGVEQLPGGRRRFRYAVTYPINNYNVTFYAGHYAHFTDTLHSPGLANPLPLRYSVIDYNVARADSHFAQVKPMLRCYEGLLGPYPFARDGYRLVEAPYLGMEHQSGIAYGNDYRRGYAGGMIPEDMNWDYLIVHESGHEYFGNALSVGDHAEMWLHESFTTYLEALYVECRLGSAAYRRYLDNQRGLISNEAPLVGPLDVNFTGFPDADYYFKGSWILHTFRRSIGDEAFLALLRKFYSDYAVGVVATDDWLAAVAECSGPRYLPFWEQYLRRAGLPRLVVTPGITPGSTVARFANVVAGFGMTLTVGGAEVFVSDTAAPVEASAQDWDAFDAEAYLIEVQLGA